MVGPARGPTWAGQHTAEHPRGQQHPQQHQHQRRRALHGRTKALGPAARSWEPGEPGAFDYPAPRGAGRAGRLLPSQALKLDPAPIAVQGGGRQAAEVIPAHPPTQGLRDGTPLGVSSPSDFWPGDPGSAPGHCQGLGGGPKLAQQGLGEVSMGQMRNQEPSSPGVPPSLQLSEEQNWD